MRLDEYVKQKEAGFFSERKIKKHNAKIGKLNRKLEELNMKNKINEATKMGLNGDLSKREVVGLVDKSINDLADKISGNIGLVQKAKLDSIDKIGDNAVKVFEHGFSALKPYGKPLAIGLGAGAGLSLMGNMFRSGDRR